MDEFEIEVFIPVELITSIFQAGSSISSIPNTTTVINQFFQSITLNKYTPNEIKQMQSKYNNSQSNEGKFLNFLTECSFHFPYSTILLENIQSVDRNSLSGYNFASIVVLYSFLAWCCTIQKTKAMPNAKNLIKDLLFTRNSSYRDLIDKTFVSTMRIFLKFCTEEDMYSNVDDFLTYMKYVDSPELMIRFLKQFWKFPTFLTNSRFFDFIQKLALTIETIGQSKSKSNTSYFNDIQINTIVRTMSTFINKLEPAALDLLVSIGHPLPLETAKLIIPTFGKSLESLILLNKPLKFDDSINDPNNNVVSFSKFEGNDLQLDFPMIDSFPGGFNPSDSNVEIPYPLHINEMMDTSVISIVEKMAKLISNNPFYTALFVDSFSDSLRIHIDTEYFASFYCILLYSCDLIKQMFINNHKNSNNLVYQAGSDNHNEFLFPTKVCLKFYNEKVFNPAITVFNKSILKNSDENDRVSTFSLINTFRHISIELMLSDDGTAFQNLLIDTICSYPLLLAELFQRLSDNVSLLYSKISSNPIIIDTLMRISINYQRFEISATAKTIDVVRKARISFFVLLSRLLSIQQFLILFFGRRISSINFLAFALEEQLTKFVFEFYKNFLILATPEEVEVTIPSIFSIFTVIVSKFGVRKSKEILFKMLDSINDAMTNHPQINYLFADDCNVLFLALPFISTSNLKKNSDNVLENINSISTRPNTLLNSENEAAMAINKPGKRRSKRMPHRSNSVQFNRPAPPPSDLELNKKLIQEMIRFFAQTASFYSISEEQVDSLIAALLSFKDSEFVVSSYNLFIQLLAGDCLPSLKPCFIIRQPQVLKLFIRVLIDSPKLTEILTFIYELCKFSLQNIKTCANSELNLILINILIRDKTEEKLPKETVELILDLLSILSIRHSSIRAVYKYISLMSMVTPTIVYRNEQLVIDTLNTIINESMNEPSSSFALTDKNVLLTNINISDLQVKQNLLSEGFTFVFWLNIEESQLNYELNIFKLSFDDEVFCKISIQHQTLFMMVNEAECNSSDKVIVIPDMNVWHFVSITFYLNENESNVLAEVDIQNSNRLYFEPLTTVLDANKISNIVLSLGGKDSTNNNESNEINNNNYVQFPSRIANCGLFPILTKDQQIELFEMGKRIANDTIIFNSSEQVKPFQFFFEFKEQNSETTGFLNVLSQQCGLSSLLPLFKLRSMHFSDGTLYEADFKFLLQFFSRVLCSSFECQKKFYQENGFIVLRTLIIENWMDQFSFKTYLTLFSLLQSLKYEDLRRSLFVEILANFSFLKKIESKPIQLRILKNWQQSLFDSCRILAIQTGIIKQILPAVIQAFSEVDYEQHRQYIYKILNDFALYTEINMQFIEYIMNSAITSKNGQITKEINDLLNFLVVETPRELFRFKFETNSFMFYIEYFFHHSDVSLQVQVLQIFINCYQKKLISGAYSSKIIFLIIETFPSYSNISGLMPIFEFISENLLKGPFFLSLLFFLAIKLNVDDMKNHLLKKSSSSFAFGSQWAVWPLLYCIKYPSQQENVLTFLINSCKNNYCQLFSQILYVFFYNNALLDQIMQKFISILQAVTIINKSVSADFYEISEFIIMFKLKIVTVQKSLSRNDLSMSNKYQNADNPNCIPINPNKTAVHDTFSEHKTIHVSYSNDTIIDDEKDQTESESSILSPSNYSYHITSPLSNGVKICEIEKIASLPDSIPYMDFEIKFIKETSIWIHKSLAIQNIEIFHEQINTGTLKSISNNNLDENEENKDDDFNNLANIKNCYIFFMLSLRAFLELYQYHDAQDFIKSLNLKETDLNENKIAVQLINYHRVRSGKEPIEEFGKVTSPLLYESNFRTFIEKNRPNRLENVIHDTFRRIELFIVHLRERIIKIRNTNNFIYFEEAEKYSKEFQKKFAIFDNKGKKVWERLWSILTFDNGPWHLSSQSKVIPSSSSSELKYKKLQVNSKHEFYRSSVLYPFAPTKMTLLSPSVIDSKFEGKVLFSVNNCFLKTVNGRLSINLIVQNEGCAIKGQFDRFFILNEWIEEVIVRCPHQSISAYDGFEIYTVFGVTFCIETGSIEMAYKFIDALNIKNKNSNLQMARYARLWMDCKLSNFDYILMINKYSGRSFNDLSFYPIAPWLTYTSTSLDELNINPIQRNLKKPFISNNIENDGEPNQQQQQTKSLLEKNDVLFYLSNVEPFKTLISKSKVQSSTENCDTNNSNALEENDNNSIINESDEKGSSLIVNKSNEEGSDLIANKSNEEGSSLIVNKSNEEGSSLIVNKSNEEGSSLIVNKSNEEGSSLIANKSNDERSSLIANKSNEEGSSLIANKSNDEGSEYEDDDELLQFSKNSTSELIPEFFSFDKITKTGIDFVYNHRQLLESPVVSASLHYWLSYSFPTMESSLSTKKAISYTHSQQAAPFHPHRLFSVPSNEINETMTYETNITGIAAACFTNSMTVEFFTLNINNSFKSGNSSTSSFSITASISNANSSSDISNASPSQNSSQQSKLNMLIEETESTIQRSSSASSYIQSLPQHVMKRKNPLKVITGSSQSDDIQNRHNNNGFVLTYKFSIQDKEYYELVGYYDDKTKPPKYGKGFLPGILRSKEIKSDISLSSHLKETSSNNKNRSKGKNQNKGNFNNNYSGLDESKSITYKMDKKEVRCSIFNNVSSIYNAAASCFIGPGTLQFKRSEFVPNYNVNLNKKNRVGTPTKSDILNDMSNSAVQVIPSQNGRLWTVLINGLVYIIEFEECSHVKSPSLVQISSLPDTLRVNVNEQQESNNNLNLGNNNNNNSSDDFRSFASSSSTVSILATAKVSLVCCSGLWTVVSVHSSSVLEVFYDKKLVNKIETFEESFKSIAFNERKKAVVCLARDSALVCDVVCGCVMAVIPSMKNAKKVLITDEWGFIVIFVESKRKKKILVFTLNGEFMREIIINEKICFMKSIRSIKGEDFLIYTAESGYLYTMNLFDAEIQGPIINIGIFRIADMFYNEEKSLLSTVSIAGAVSFVPLTLSP